MGPVVAGALKLRRIHWHVVLALLGLVLARPSLTMNMVGSVLVLAGLGVRVWAAGYLEKGGALCAAGPYAHVRHPLYLGSFVSAVGFCVMVNTLWGWTLVLPLFVLLYAVQVLLEERHLRVRYGEDHARYAARVPMLMPRFTAARTQSAPWLLKRALANREHWHVLLTLLLAGLFFVKWRWG